MTGQSKINATHPRCTHHPFTCTLNGIRKTCQLKLFHLTGKENVLTNIPLWSFGDPNEWYCVSDADLLYHFELVIPITIPGILESCPPLIKYQYECDIRTSCSGYFAGWFEETPIGKIFGSMVRPMLNLWDWTFSIRQSL